MILRSDRKIIGAGVPMHRGGCTPQRRIARKFPRVEKGYMEVLWKVIKE